MKGIRSKAPVLGCGMALLFLLFGFSPQAFSQDQDSGENLVSPQRGINQPEGRGQKERGDKDGSGDRDRDKDKGGRDLGFRSIDGTGNNTNNPEMGATFTDLRRLLSSDYGDGISTLAGENRPSAREVSNGVATQEGSILNPLGTSDYLWQWGQFLDHDIDLTEGVDPPEPADIVVPTGDPFFDPDSTGTEVIAFNRSIFNPGTGLSVDNPRQQENEITAWIDASNVYGSDEERASALRTNDGTGKLKTSEGNLLPFNTEGLPNAGGDSDALFLAGDPRANEQAGLTAMHTLFVREHNRLAESLSERDGRLSGDEIYMRARQIVGAQMQSITYNEFLPALLGEGAIPRYKDYDKRVDASIINMFSTAAYRFGHSALSPTLLRLDSSGNEIPEGSLALRDAFFNTGAIIDEGGIEPILRGLAAQAHQRVDNMVIDDIRNFLFGPPGAGGFDLASLNLQRGRDHGLPSYNDAREGLGLARAQDFSDVSSDPEVVSRLSSVYESVDDIDLWIGGLSEDPLPGGHLGELFAEIIVIQFESLRDGDRFWYTRDLSKEDKREVENTTLSDIIKRNTDIGDELQDNVFFVAP